MMGTKRKKMDFAGLRRRETYQEIINYLENEQEIIHYPNRTAKFLRESPYLTQLDGEGQRTLEEQQLNAMKQREKENILREMGYNGNGKGGSKGNGKGKRALSRAERGALEDEFFDAEPDPFADTAAGPMDGPRPLEDLTGVATYPMDRTDDDGVYATDGGDNSLRRFIREEALPSLARGTGKLVYHGVKGVVEYGPTVISTVATGVLNGLEGVETTARYLHNLTRRGAPRAPIDDYEPDLGGSSSSGLGRGAVPAYLLDRSESDNRPGTQLSMGQRGRAFLGGRRFRSQDEREQDRRDAYERADLVRFR